MKRKQRGPWVALTSRYALCSYCRYGDWEESMAHPCTHPLEAVVDRGGIMEPRMDCWGFRPAKGDTVAAAFLRLVGWLSEDAPQEAS